MLREYFAWIDCLGAKNGVRGRIMRGRFRRKVWASAGLALPQLFPVEVVTIETNVSYICNLIQPRGMQVETQ